MTSLLIKPYSPQITIPLTIRKVNSEKGRKNQKMRNSLAVQLFIADTPHKQSYFLRILIILVTDETIKKDMK